MCFLASQVYKWRGCGLRMHHSENPTHIDLYDEVWDLVLTIFRWAFVHRSFPGGSEVKASACNAGELGSFPGSGRSPGEGNGNSLQYSCLENPMDRGAWWATVHGIAESDTTERLHFHFSLSLDIEVDVVIGLDLEWDKCILQVETLGTGGLCEAELKT